MDTVFDILQALGIGAAVGIRPFLPTLLVCALAVANVGIDFGGTDWSFLESPAFLTAIFVLLVLSVVLYRRYGDQLEVPPGRTVVAIVVGVLGALLGAGSVADHGGPTVVGIIIGALAAVGALLAIDPLFVRVRKRLDDGADAVLSLYREAAALVSAAASVLFPPLAILVVGAIAWLGAGSRRREGEKYAGLRVLR